MTLPDIVDERALRQMLVDSLEHYRNENGSVPVSTAILFEPYHRCWGIYHSARLMHRDDSPGDYDVHNSGAGEMDSSAFERDRTDLVNRLSAIGESFSNEIESTLLPSQLISFSLDYDEVWRWPSENSRSEQGAAGQPATPP
ncbi:MAG: hypothetical protein H7A55_12090 [Verrucomicrobiaceae bacterium]|nr:hypothetical protein [Verrucomicrobiaceae bacterium]